MVIIPTGIGTEVRPWTACLQTKSKSASAMVVGIMQKAKA